MYHGKPNWFELTAPKGALSQAGDFYAKVLGWRIADAGMDGFVYHLASHEGDMIAGLYEAMPDCGAPDVSDAPPSWMIYLDVDDADAAAVKTQGLGGAVIRPAADIPGVGRFAVLADPQGAVFGVLEPGAMDAPPDPSAGAWNQQKESHGNWIELMSSDPAAAADFYTELFGWTLANAMDMGEMGTYQLFAFEGTEIGGMMGLGDAPAPYWLPYFGVNGVDAAITRIVEAGGTVLHGPTEVPGPAFIAMARDPQGAYFAIVGPKA